MGAEKQKTCFLLPRLQTVADVSIIIGVVVKLIVENIVKKYRLKVWGDFACFTRPEMKAERVSYDVMTPSAARSIFEAIHWNDLRLH